MPFTLDEFLPYRLNIAASLISRRFSALHHKETGLSIPEWRVMAHLANEGQVSIRDIHHKVNLDKSIVSRAANRLEQAGHLRKMGHATDGRLISLELTEQGQRMMQLLGTIATKFQKELLDELGPGAGQFFAVLERLIASDSKNSRKPD